VHGQPDMRIDIVQDRLNPRKIDFKINGVAFSWGASSSFKKNYEVIRKIAELTGPSFSLCATSPYTKPIYRFANFD